MTSFRYSSANLAISGKDSSLWVVVSVPAPKKGGVIDTISTRFMVGVPSSMGDLAEGDVCRFESGYMTKVGSLG